MKELVEGKWAHLGFFFYVFPGLDQFKLQYTIWRESLSILWFHSSIHFSFQAPAHIEAITR